MRALLDGDIYAFRPASSAEGDNLSIAIARMEEMIDNTLAAVGADEFSIFLSGENNFRYSVYPEYKANRTQPKPRFLRDCKQYLIDKYKAEVSDGCEADDLLGIAQCKAIEENDGCAFGIYNVPLTVICSLDKDLRMIPGNHYSFEISGTSSLGKKWVKPAEHVNVSEDTAIRNFYYQVLVGDSTDNIKGVKGIGPKKANFILDDAEIDWEVDGKRMPLEYYYLAAVEGEFSTQEELVMTGQCLWIFRKPNDVWRIPNFETTKREGQGPEAATVGEGHDS